jgi:hypothetical protein
MTASFFTRSLSTSNEPTLPLCSSRSSSGTTIGSPGNQCYGKMAPDDLHSIFGGLLGSHFPNIICEVSRLLPMGETAFKQLMDVRLHRCYTFYRPCGMRLPTKKNFFTSSYSVPSYEWKAILQVLPVMVAGLCKVGGRDVLAEWAVAFADWVFGTLWTPDGAHNKDTLKELDMQLFVLKQKCKQIAGLQKSAWNFQNFHAASKFSAFIQKYAAAKWGSTERGEHKHHWVKIWWRERTAGTSTEPFCKRELSRCIWKPSVDKVDSIGTTASDRDSELPPHTSRLADFQTRFLFFCRWQDALGFESLELQRAEVKEVMRRQTVYNSAIMEALGSNIACIRVHYILSR